MTVRTMIHTEPSMTRLMHEPCGCTHDGGALDQGELEDCRIMCPRHGAYFDVRTGAALTLPAVMPVRTYAVRVQDDAIYFQRSQESDADFAWESSDEFT